LELDLSAVRAYFKYLNALPLAASTKCVRRQAVKARLRATLSSAGFNRQARLEMMLRSLDHDSETKAPGFVIAGVAEDRIVTKEQFDRLVSGTSKRTSLFLWILYNTGCRVAEMCSARLDKCEELGDMVRLTIMGKGKKERKVDIEKSLFEAIRKVFTGETYLFQTRGGKPYLPTYVSYEIIKAGKRILGRRISAHSMRHSFATLAIRAGGAWLTAYCDNDTMVICPWS
jgi:integrase